MMMTAAAAASAASHAQQALLTRESREDAQWLAKPTHARLLQPPAHSRLAGDTRHQPVLSLENWLHRRGWSSPDDHDSQQQQQAIAAPGLRVLSHLLSYPLTLAHFLSHICPQATAGSSSSSSQQQPSSIVMLGARAEATLPSLWWRELLCYHGGGRPLRLHLHMVGPELPAGNKGTAGGSGGERVPAAAGAGAGQQQQEEGEGSEGRGGGELLLFRHPGLYHELLGTTSSSLPAKPAAFVAFNPGFGHPHLSKDWGPTLEAALLPADAPASPVVLWTAHSAADMERDVAWLDRFFSQQGQGQGTSPQPPAIVDWLLAPMPNPFASRKRVAGGIGDEAEAVVQANLHVGVFRVRRL